MTCGVVAGGRRSRAEQFDAGKAYDLSGGVRHVWVKPTNMPTEMPGLVVEWSQSPEGWRALVTYVEPRGRAVTEWLDSDQLRPATEL